MHGVVTSMEELGVSMPEGALAFARRASDDLYAQATPLIDAGSEGADEMAQTFQSLVAERDAALTDGTFTQWFPGLVDRVANCFAEFGSFQEQAE